MIRIHQSNDLSSPEPIESPHALKLQMWLVTGACPQTQRPVVLYHGNNLEHAKQVRRESAALGLGNVAIRDAGRVYPPPELTPECRCASEPERSRRCLYGHPDECHYPLYCPEADCAHLATLDDDGADELTNWLEGHYRDTDVWFAGTSPVAGEQGCLCSRCGNVCVDEPLRILDAERVEEGEWRYCGGCVA